jgi:hypothetical protein
MAYGNGRIATNKIMRVREDIEHPEVAGPTGLELCFIHNQVMDQNHPCVETGFKQASIGYFTHQCP